MSTLEVKSEVAYDLVQDHFETILALLDRPMPRGELVSRLGEESTLQRLLRHGLLVADGELYRAASNVYQQVRQEGMMTFLSRYVLPALTRSVDDDGGFAGLATRRLALSAAAMSGLRSGRVHELFAELGDISDTPALGPTGRLSVLVVGTSDVTTEAGDEAETALRHLQRAARQRANPTEKSLAILTQGDFMADAGRYQAACEAVERFLTRLEGERAAGAEATYHLTVAHHWQTPRAVDARHVVRQ